MLKSLKFVQGAITKKNLMPALTHFRIKDGHVMGSNGMITLSSPIALDLDVSPKAAPFIKAIQTCKTTVQMSLTPANKLAIRSGGFKAFIDCNEEPYPEIIPDGENVPVPEGFLDSLKNLERFIAEDDSRRWARGILFRGESAFATNNVILAQFWLGAKFPCDICIPDPAVQELIRLGEEPISVQISEKALTFHFEGDRWLRAQAYDTAWPPVEELLDKCQLESVATIDADFFTKVAELTPFTDELNRLYFKDGRLMTQPTEDAGASMECSIAQVGIFNAKQLRLLEGVITNVDFTQYPKPCPFFGDNVRGLIVGIKP